MKKNIDIKALLREGLKAAKKQHGILVEREEPELQEAYKRKNIQRIFGPIPLDSEDKEVLRAVGINREFDLIKDMPAIDLSADFSKEDKVSEAASVEPLFAKIRGGQSNPRKTLENLAKVLGIGTTGGELSTIGDQFSSGEAGDTGLFAAVLLYKSLHDIVRENEAQSAGRVWEIFFTRLLGGSSARLGGTDTIIDVKGEDGVLYSLKLINEETQITGSKAFLVDEIRKGNKIVYILGVKSEPTNVGGVKSKPFYLKFSSFVIDETNYMLFLGNKSESELYGDQKGSDVFVNQFATVWDNFTRSGKIEHSGGSYNKETKQYFNIGPFREIFKKWMENPETLDLSKVAPGNADKYAPPVRVTSEAVENKKFNLDKGQWDEFIAGFASGEVPYAALGKFVKGDLTNPETQALTPVFDKYMELMRVIESLNEAEKDPAKAMSLQEFFLLYSALYSAKFQRNKVGKPTEDSMYSSLINGITKHADISKLINSIKKDPSMSKDKITANLDALIKMQEIPEQGKFKAALLAPLASNETNAAMVVKRIITFRDDTQSSSTNLNNQMKALRNALATRFDSIVNDASYQEADRKAAKIAVDSINNFVFNKYENIKSENARKIYQAILNIRSAYTFWLEKMRSKRASDASLEREKVRIGSNLGLDKRKVALQNFLKLIDVYSVKGMSESIKHLNEAADEAEPLQSPDAAEAAATAKETAAKEKEAGNFAFDQSKLIGQADFIYLNKEKGSDGNYTVDVEWPTIVLDPKMAFYNAERSREALMAYIAPIFEAAFYLNAGAVGYFGKDIDQGLVLAQKSVEYLQKNLSSDTQKPNEPQSVKESLKRDELDDMIDELFK